MRDESKMEEDMNYLRKLALAIIRARYPDPNDINTKTGVQRKTTNFNQGFLQGEIAGLKSMHETFGFRLDEDAERAAYNCAVEAGIMSRDEWGTVKLERYPRTLSDMRGRRDA